MGPRRGERQTTGGGSPAGPSRGRLLAVALVLAVAGALAWATWRPSPGPVAGSSTGAASSPGSPTASGLASAPETPAEFASLVGNWRRPDGGYELSVSGVAADGTATVAYFNPRPIRVARAEARREGGRLSLFVEFDHPNYPGSTYTLDYDRANDTLQGIYYQAVQRASYDVVFVRRP